MCLHLQDSPLGHLALQSRCLCPWANETDCQSHQDWLCDGIAVLASHWTGCLKLAAVFSTSFVWPSLPTKEGGNGWRSFMWPHVESDAYVTSWWEWRYLSAVSWRHRGQVTPVFPLHSSACSSGQLGKGPAHLRNPTSHDLWLQPQPPLLQPPLAMMQGLCFLHLHGVHTLSSSRLQQAVASLPVLTDVIINKGCAGLHCLALDSRSLMSLTVTEVDHLLTWWGSSMATAPLVRNNQQGNGNSSTYSKQSAVSDSLVHSA